MEFYIAPDEKSDFSKKSDFLRINSPEELTVCDPAVGSAHMLTYAFDLLYAIYEEEGYNAPDIPRLILQKNLTGLEIDERAGALAAFALVMKARAQDRRFLRRDVAPNVVVLRPIVFSEAELDAEVAALSPLVIPRSAGIDCSKCQLSTRPVRDPPRNLSTRPADKIPLRRLIGMTYKVLCAMT